MKRRTVLAALLPAIAGCLDGPNRPDARYVETRLTAAINDYRRSHGVAEVDGSETLQTASRNHSADMHDREFYDHRNPDGNEPADRVDCRVGEVIHRGEIGLMRNVDSTQEWDTRETAELVGFVMDGWENSPPHRQIVVDRQWQTVGVGVHIGEDEFFVTAKFC